VGKVGVRTPDTAQERADLGALTDQEADGNE
jgi:hypothetical protein